MEPHQQRVVDEKSDLDTRLIALQKFIAGSPVFEQLPEAEQDRLRKQEMLMAALSGVLHERIAAFPVAPTDAEAWAWLEDKAWNQHFRPHRYPKNAPDKLWRLDVPTDDGRENWHYGPTFIAAVKVAIVDEKAAAARAAETKAELEARK